MNLIRAKEEVKIHFACSFFRLLLFSCLLLHSLSKDPVLEKALADHARCTVLPFFFPKRSEFFCFSVQKSFSELGFPESPSLKTLSTILDGSVGIGLWSEGWSS